MRAALQMYDRVETRDATDRYWALIREALRARDIPAPDTLSRPDDPWDLWQAPDLVLAQTCGLPFRARLAGKVALVGTPDFALPGCPPGHYNSVLVTRARTGLSLEAALAGRIAVNDALSQSGWGALTTFAATRGLRLGTPHLTGGHQASAREVALGHADLAAIDAQSWRLFRRHLPWTDDLTELARTAPTPALPLITALGRDPVPIADAVREAIAALDHQDRAALDLQGLIAISESAYMALEIPPNP